MKIRQYQQLVSSLTRRFRVDAMPFAGVLVLLLFSSHFSYAQPDSGAIDVAKIRLFRAETEGFQLSVHPKQEVSDSAIPSLSWRRFSSQLPPEYMEKDIFLRFVFTNSSDSAKEFFFLPGYYVRHLKIFQASTADSAASFRLLPDSTLLVSKRFEGATLLKLQAHETAIFYCRFNFVRTNVNNFLPRIIEKDYMGGWLGNLRDKDYLLDSITYVSTGLLLLMIFYSMAVYMQNRNREFLYYAIYTFCTACLLFLKTLLRVEANAFNYFYEEYLDFMVLIASVFTYLFFVRQFLDTRRHHPRLDQFLKWAKRVLIVATVAFSIIYFFTDKYVVLNIMENYVIKLFFFATGIVFIVYAVREKDPLLNYLGLGNLALVVFSIISLLLMIFKWRFISEPSTWNIVNRSMFYYEIGLVLELVFFLSGLAYKNRRDIIERVKERERLKLENERKEFEKQMAVITAMQQERDRISADMHDELGSGVTAIRLMSEILKSRMKDQPIMPELEKISSNANDLLGKMNTIIWTMKSSNDTVESLVAYIRAHAIEYFDSTPIDCSVRLPVVIPQVEISGEKRRNIFLSIKEALNNAMKHSQATLLHIDIIAKDHKLVILITDNGIGINTDQLRRFGNGLSNMRRRMESIGGSFNIDCGEKCVLTFEAPLT
jgi:signal transduction histidine kinase